MKKVTSKELIDLINKLPDSDSHIFENNGRWHVTQEWLCGSFAGVSFGARTVESSANMLIDYLYRHIGLDSIVGRYVSSPSTCEYEKVNKYVDYLIQAGLVEKIEE